MPGLHTPFILIHASETWTILIESMKTANVKTMFKNSLDIYICKKVCSFTVRCWLYHCCVLGGQTQNQGEEILLK